MTGSTIAESSDGAELPPLPDLPYESWRETVQTLHRFCQVVGKVRLAAAPRRNHWWNVPLHLGSRGLTTRPMGGSGAPVFTIDLDLLDHRLHVTTSTGGQREVALSGLSVAAFHDHLLQALGELGIDVQIAKPYPYDLPDADRPFSADTEHTTYDTGAVAKAWQVLNQVNLMLEDFAAQWSGKTSPVHLFWHSFDLAFSRFSDVPVPPDAGAGAVAREGYSRELMAFGFWFGDDSFPEPACYAYVAPEPEGLTDQPLSPAVAQWRPSGGGHLALLRYADLRTAADPYRAAGNFFDSAYRAGAHLSTWDWHRHDSPGGVTDPLL